MNDFIGNAIVENEPMKPKQARLMGQLLNMTAYYGLNNLPAKFYLLALRLMVCYHMKPKDALRFTHVMSGTGDDFHGL